MERKINRIGVMHVSTKPKRQRYTWFTLNFGYVGMCTSQCRSGKRFEIVGTQIDGGFGTKFWEASHTLLEH